MNKITIQFHMTKGTGDLPNIKSIPKKKRQPEYIRSCMKFCEDFFDVEDHIESWKILDDGLKGISLSADCSICGYPSPVIEFILKYEVELEEFRNGVWTSSYSLNIPECNQEEVFYFEDHNGYTTIIDNSK